ncbi:hypothetical protein [Pseudomarimonas salicorniae]|uniref:Uncharacterized protein n=1 Tax=Pseudomarimonas salicorniae TaxID=2933270 RepID=A0ABT0GFR7_9GAMM|nr:hypothetical protein [Lysobacter sp. CAU 1642]MCK7592887.1 hypothetical protein [Lysobacter sp. CAU 1642]
MSETPESPPRLQLPRLTTPTWEIELLISGALVFSLFSLREPLEVFFRETLPVVTEAVQPLVWYTYLYGKVVLFALMITFVLHLAARARWVALVGVHSIYPQGPRWDNLSGGPLVRKLTRERTPRVEDAIEQADNRASMIFGYGILAAQLGLVILAVSLAMFGVVAVLRALGAPEAAELWLMGSVVAVLILPMLVDKWLLPRLREGHWISRVCESAMKLSLALTFGRAQQPLTALITTNIGGRHGAWLLVGVLYAVIGLAALDTFARIDREQRLRGDALGKTSREFGIYPAHYADQRVGIYAFNSAPFVDSEIAEGPYLRLTIPYFANRHDEWLDKHCPEPEAATNLDEAGARARRESRMQQHQARVDCFAHQFDIRLDGKPLHGLSFLRLQRTDDLPDGITTLIDIRDLTHGHHTLRLESIDLRSREDNSTAMEGGAEKGEEGTEVAETDDGPAPHVIDFWR